MTKTRHKNGSKAGGKKPRFTGRGTKPRAGAGSKPPAKRTRREPCPRSRAKRKRERRREHEAESHETGGSEAGTDHGRKEMRVVYRDGEKEICVVYRDGEMAHEERETT
jgi:hypothetical protein